MSYGDNACPIVNGAATHVDFVIMSSDQNLFIRGARLDQDEILDAADLLYRDIRRLSANSFKQSLDRREPLLVLARDRLEFSGYFFLTGDADARVVSRTGRRRPGGERSNPEGEEE